MAKFHVTKSGRTEPCGATIKPCPLGGDEVHYTSPEAAARANVEAEMHRSAERIKELESEIAELDAEEAQLKEHRAKLADPAERARARKLGAQAKETLASFTRDSSFFSEYGYMNQDDATEVAQILWHREHGTPLNMFQEGALAQAFRAHTAEEWSFDPSDAGRQEAWRQHLRENLPATMRGLES